MERENVAFLYQARSDQVFPEIKITPVDDQRVLVRVRVNTSDLIADRASLDSIARWTVMIRPAYYDNYRKLIPADSLSIIASAEQDPNKRELEGSFTQPCKINTEGIINIQIIDLHRNTINHFSKIINRKNAELELTGELTRANDSLVIIKPFIYDWAAYILRFPYLKVHSVKMIYFGHHFPMPEPPFSQSRDVQFSFDGDERKEFKITDTLIIKFEKTGIYHFLPAGEVERGFTVFKWGKGFPIPGKNTETESLAYILSGEEFNVLKEKENGAFEFWNGLSADAGQNAALRKIWIDRMEMSNRLFTSYVEGWQTDRGMIYMIFGPPEEVYRSEEEENWVMKTKPNSAPLVFSFRKVGNPLSDNDYGLERNPGFKISWYDAVERWRKGLF